MREVQEEEAISLEMYHDPVKNTLWYIDHTDDRASTLLNDGRTRLNLIPDPSGRWKLVWIRETEIYHLWVSADEFDEAQQVWRVAERITNSHPELLSGKTAESFCNECPIRATCEITWELGDTVTVDLRQAKMIEAGLAATHRRFHI